MIQKKIDERLAAIASKQKSAQLQQQKKIEERLVTIALKQNAAQLQKQTTLSDEVRKLTSAKPDYLNLKCVKCENEEHCNGL